MVNSVFKLATPPVSGMVPPFSAASKEPSSPDEFPGGQDNASTPKASLPTTPTEVIVDSDTESNGTIDLEHPKYSQESSLQSGRSLRKQTRHLSSGSKDSKDGAPSSKRAAVKKE